MVKELQPARLPLQKTDNQKFSRIRASSSNYSGLELETVVLFMSVDPEPRDDIAFA